MREALRAELLKTRSGYAMLGLFAYAIASPAILLCAGPSLDELTSLGDRAATRTVFGAAASCMVAAMFLGSYVVTREYYYKSVLRAFLQHGRTRVFVAKALTAVVGGLSAGAIGVAAWAFGTWAVLCTQGLSPVVDGQLWGAAAGTVWGSGLAGLWGASVAWIIRGYYPTTAVVLLFPLAVEFPLLLNAPEVARFLPGGALAGLAQIPVKGLLPAPESALLFLLWTAVATVAARRLVQRREAV
ncbi:hypothetical protein EST92_25620 [Streptomyces sp. TM32]|uniref:hypothetical protein n=1 Tax=Streptomyces sp. TM32 TaxID=1652669 RepID=UPI00101012D7|nr:hypothetical protein [Streptomyces sp. TM32]RXS69393.1 hypothetical protein EST92_25620 [Streptomyces sp. TM32]